jgi:hypothetical protein
VQPNFSAMDRMAAHWTDTRGRAQRPCGPRGHAARGNTCSVEASGPSSLGIGPPTNPVRFKRLTQPPTSNTEGWHSRCNWYGSTRLESEETVRLARAFV